MRTKWVKRVVVSLLWMSVSAAWAQTDSLLYQAERLLNWQAYGRAIDAYTHLLTDSASRLSAAQRATAQERLAFTYLQIGDNAKAERFYRESLESDSTENPQRILQYAKALAGNGKFSAAQRQYEHYLQLNEKQPSRQFSSMPTGNSNLLSARRDTVRYRLDYLALNSPNEEFSPAFYQDGLVYVSGTNGGSAVEMGGRGSRGYLDLYYAPQRNSLKALEITSADGTTRPSTVSVNQRGQGPGVGDDYYTPQTANDSPTLPGFGTSINITEGLGYGSRPVKPEQRFRQTLNTRDHEGPATFSRDGSRIIFTRSANVGRARDSTEDGTRRKLYTARQLNGAWTDVTELPFNSDAYSVGHPTLSRDEQRLYFSSDMPGGSGGTDLYVSRYQNGQWSKPVNLGAGINTSGNELFPFVDDGGNLYFATDGRRGLGGLDLFMATMETDTTARRVDHLDRPLNSPQDDFGLITDGSRRSGYFSSNRRGGSDDIYRFVRESSLLGCRDLTLRIYDIQTDQPLDSVRIDVKFRREGQPSQTLSTNPNGFVQLCLEADNEFVFQASRDGFVSSTVGFTTRHLTDDQPSRLEIGLGKPTVLVDTIALEPPIVAEPRALTRSRIRGVVISDRDHRPLDGVTVRLHNECDQSLATYVTGPDGRYVFNLVEGCDYTLTASKLTFGTNINRIRQVPAKTRPRDLSADLRMLSIGDVVTIDNIYYDLDQFSLRPDATRELDKLVATMRKYPTLMIEIRSYTDSRGDAARNQALSTQRAKAVAGYLTSRGISRRRMTTVGLGESQLVNNCTDGVICTDAEHQRNRRTEFKVVEIK